MQSGEFFERFVDRQEIGRDITETHLSVFYDNGRDVGMWREERATTVGAGSVLAPDDAAMARYWCSRDVQDHVSGGNFTAAGRVLQRRLHDAAPASTAGRKR